MRMGEPLTDLSPINEVLRDGHGNESKIQVKIGTKIR